jgi:alpha-ketoglutarate-dependent sulfate ester dioxygenase
MTTVTEISRSSRIDDDLQIGRVGGSIGAEIRGIHIDADLDDGTIHEIRQALVRHKVLFIRDQQHLDDASHEEFAARFGDVIAHPTVPVSEGSRYLLELDSKEGYAASSWHTDVTFVDSYPAASFLRAVRVPEAGGDTLWANTEAAYENLSEPLRLLADQLWALHSNLYDYAAVGRPPIPPDRVEQHRAVFTSTLYETEHPVVRVHPESGKRSLVTGHFLKQFVGLSRADSQRLFALFQDHITLPEHTVRWRWRAGDLAIWDNRATQHRAIADFGTQRRTLRRATIAGDAPVGIDGRVSRIVKKTPRPVAAA